MHLALSASDLGRQRGGNESYLLGLIDGLAAIASTPVAEGGRPDLRVTMIVAREGERLAASLADRHGFDVVDVGPYRRLPFLLWQQTAVLRRLRPDWCVSTFFLPPAVPCRAAVLVHDVSYRAHPDYFPRTIAAYMRLLVGLAIRRAEAVIALSEFTRQEVLRFYPAAARRTAVVYPGVGAEFRPDGDPLADDQALTALGDGCLDPRRPYLLAVGNIHPRKNLARLLEAWERLRAAGRPVPAMAWAGLDRWASGDLVRRAQAAGVHLLGFVPPASLPALYRRATALAYPSLYEGFGLPPLEAMACGAPVLAANTTSLPEAVGDAAVTVDPEDVAALAAGLEQILFDDGLRAELRQRGLARATGLRWQRTAAQLLSCLARGAA